MSAYYRVFESCFGIKSSIFTHSHWNKLLLWTLKALPLLFFFFQSSFYLGCKSYIILELRALSSGELVCAPLMIRENYGREDEMVGWPHRVNGHKLGKLWEIVRDKEARHVTVHEVTKSQTRLSD